VALDRDDIHRLVECYGAAHGYLIHQFLSPATNQRSDEFWRPTLFLDLVLEAVRRAAPDLVVGIRVSVLEGTPGGLDAGRTLELVRSARLDLLDFIDVWAGNYQAGQWMVQPGEWRLGVLAPYAAPYRDLGLPSAWPGGSVSRRPPRRSWPRAGPTS
jgi:2,4-dienoyl-CoA reductase-like NADH-dependent reductase (Old Yellow Enzyme family)